MKRAILMLVALALLLSGVAQARADIYNAAADFSSTSNPNSVWSYGSSPLLSPDTFGVYTQRFADPSGINGWGANPFLGGNPSVFDNPTASTITFFSLQLSPGELALHPGPSDQVSIVQFTAPSAGTYDLSATFRVDDLHGPGSGDGVHVLVNGSSIFNQILGTGFHDFKSFSTALTLTSGATVDFAVDLGTNGSRNYGFNTTGLDATLTAVPEPATLTLLGIGIAGMAGYGWRRRKLAAA